MSEPTPHELNLIKKFRLKVADLELTDEERTDMRLVAWLRARDLDMKKAYEMLIACLQWRKDHDIANILEWTPPANYPSDFEYAYTGEDPTGCPVCIAPFGRWDVRRAMESGEKEIWLKYIDKLFASVTDYLTRASKKKEEMNPTGFNVVTQFVLIIDLRGFSMRQLTCMSSIDSLKEVVRRIEANYPEILKAAYLINAPFIFNLLFSIVKPLLSKRTLGKLDISGCNENKWRAFLFKHIYPENLPVAYGGTHPVTFRGDDNSFLGDEGQENIGTEFIRKVVNAGEKFEVEIDIQHPHTILKWAFKTEGYDIGFSIIFNDKTEVVQYHRRNSHVEPVEGTLLCDKPGKYFLKFDNTYSRMTKKTLHYIVTHSFPTDTNDEDI